MVEFSALRDGVTPFLQAPKGHGSLYPNHRTSFRGWAIWSGEKRTVCQDPFAPLSLYQHRLTRLSTGDLIYLGAVGSPGVLIINSYEAIVDLCERMGEVYASRPTRALTVELWDQVLGIFSAFSDLAHRAGFDFMFSSMPYGEKYRVRRLILPVHHFAQI